jgi:hypothetical protein
MPKDDKTKKKAGSGKSKATSKAGKDDDAPSEPVELEATKSKKGEPDDNLKRRAEWFQKRTSG